MLKLNGKAAVITGSTSGIGQGVARVLASYGCNIVLNGFGNPDVIEKDRKYIEDTYKVKAIYNAADMTKPDEIDALIQQCVSEFGSIDVLVNNAGIQHVCPIDEFPIEKWNQILAINLSASFHSIRSTIPHMKKQGWGRIINIASAHAIVASPFKSAYVAAKHGIAGMTKVVALEAAEHNITCNAICPGYVWTPLVEGQVADTAKARGISEEEVKKNVLLAAQPTKKFVQVEDVGEFTAFLCSDAAANISGTLLPIDGGWTCH